MPSAFVARFRTLARERSVAIRARVARLATGVGDDDDLAEIRRDVHTTKGEARVVGLAQVGQALHEIETLLEASDLLADAAKLEALIARLDAVDDLLDAPAPAGAGGESVAPAAPVAPALLERAAKQATDARLRVDAAALSRIARAIGELRAGEADLDRVVDDVAQIAELVRRDDAEDAGRRVRIASDLRRLAARVKQLAFEQHTRLDRLVQHVRDVRMVPLATLLESLPRAGRELAADLGKEVEVAVSGADVEVDRQVLDVIAEPMLHLVRNAIDHGIEPPDERLGQGKARAGRIDLSARSLGSQVVVEVRDDGRGVDVARLGDVLRERGEGDLDPALLDEEDLLEILCRAGLSTRRQVSDVSGRGVGLDVVKRRVESVGGRLSLRSIVGAGTTFRLEVPMSALLAPMVGVVVGEARYAFAPEEIARLVELRSAAIEGVGRGRILRVDDVPLPLFDLAALAGTARRDAAARETALVLSHGARRIAVAVDRVVGTVPVLQQRLDPFLEGAETVRSVALFATGELAVVLDLAALFRAAAGRLAAPDDVLDAGEGVARRARRVLVVDDSELTRDVVVATLREMDVDIVEAIDGRAALEAMARSKPDLVVTDLDMPIVDGFELLRRIRNEPAWASLPVIVLSTRGSAADVQRASELGADAHLVKNRIELDQLRRVIEAHLDEVGA